jgi:peptide/nickel transport system substrate-binding protein
MMPKHVYEGKDLATHPANRAPVGLGPFKFQSWESGRSITFVRNPYYWENSKPYLDSVVFALIPNPQQRLNAIVNGEVNWFRPEAVQVLATQGRPRRPATIKVVRSRTTRPKPRWSTSTCAGAVEQPQGAPGAVPCDRPPAHRARTSTRAWPKRPRTRCPSQFKNLHDPSVDYDKLYPYDTKKAGSCSTKRASAEGRQAHDDRADRTSRARRMTRSPRWCRATGTRVGVDVKLSGLDRRSGPTRSTSRTLSTPRSFR